MSEPADVTLAQSLHETSNMQIEDVIYNSG